MTKGREANAVIELSNKGQQGTRAEIRPLATVVCPAQCGLLAVKAFDGGLELREELPRVRLSQQRGRGAPQRRCGIRRFQQRARRVPDMQFAGLDLVR